MPAFTRAVVSRRRVSSPAIAAASAPARSCSSAAAKKALFTSCRSPNSATRTRACDSASSRALEIRARAERGIENALLDPEMRVVGVFGRQEKRLTAGNEGRRGRHVRLKLHLPFDGDGGLAFGVDVADAKIRLGLLQPQLREPRVGVDRRLLQGRQLQDGRGRGRHLLRARCSRAERAHQHEGRSDCRVLHVHGRIAPSTNAVS